MPKQDLQFVTTFELMLLAKAKSSEGNYEKAHFGIGLRRAEKKNAFFYDFFFLYEKCPY